MAVSRRRYARRASAGWCDDRRPAQGVQERVMRLPRRVVKVACSTRADRSKRQRPEPSVGDAELTWSEGVAQGGERRLDSPAACAFRVDCELPAVSQLAGAQCAAVFEPGGSQGRKQAG
jgi:hypothetical protein